ncbi:MAG TPA: tRNA preQ1(34) S-adenosylmethionine ribosyltransferase-isomerase QueA [Kiritimatiellia bacterium]|nr:tRNA preQ1(34) S-adenosylmethionine ribosyltransferase-isomerase QueA [Kiritimatiellia bacterium]HPJ56023.1 tRNA preQ1(34) S-adenosylmethionine ribosyltransferase-isomerase QueA [Kiritimatiellia bacterium]HPR67997.1 tRNA preQ1(34) S-adenosylmethionine ribosyltransferase-isomerase QueA [Kiritimatiellia bacterium]HRX05590.1 tRNA preQ1(34) S-adenosylmethionine ribosyltransferase-isomerase QueA [Kiritimatiellia bacterium]
MKVADFDYELPPELIAQEPAERRDGARMMVLDRAARTIEHRRFTDLPDYLHAPDLLVVNDTRVIPARLFGRKAKAGTGGKVEFLLLEETAPGQWDALMRCRRRPKPGEQVILDEDLAVVTVLEDGELGRVKIRVESALPWLEVLERIGQTPLPPYIQRKNVSEERRLADKHRYQTVFAREPGAVAAPTAGLHFTPDVLERLAARGIGHATVTLHVGIGTFRPVSVENVRDHRMDFERWEVPEETARRIAGAKAAGGRVVAVGTTSVRTLESAAVRPEGFGAGQGRTDLFIHPPYAFRMVDAMVTNFHLPKSTLIMMISAFAGREFVLEAYREAIRERYRFYSYGDCMLMV